MNTFFSSCFWSEIIPQIAHTEPSIHHALVTLSVFHEQFILQDCPNNNEQSRFGLQQYNLAIRALLDSKTFQSSPIVGLLCCLLFISIELLQGKLASAMYLSKSGKKVLSEIRNIHSDCNLSRSMQNLYTDLKAHFIRFDFQVTAMQNTIDSEIHFSTCFDIPALYPDSVRSLSSVSEAHQRYEEISQAWVQHIWSYRCDYRDIDPSLFSQRLRQWNSAFQDLLEAQKHSFTARDRRGAAILKLNQRQFELSLMLATMSPDQQPNYQRWDDRAPYFQEIIDYAATAAGLSEDLDSVFPCFSLDSGINVHLFTVAYRCRDPIIRRKAVAVIRSANRHEGLWRGDFIAHVMDRVIMLEEEGLNVRSGYDVPEEARIRDLKVHFDSVEPKVETRYVQKGRVVDEVISWQESATQFTLSRRRQLTVSHRRQLRLKKFVSNPDLHRFPTPQT